MAPRSLRYSVTVALAGAVPMSVKFCAVVIRSLPEEPVSQDDPNEALALDARTEPSDETDGPDETEALDAITALIGDYFGEGQ